MRLKDNLDGTNKASDYVLPCHECQAGQMHREYVVYYTWIGDDLITVPDFPAWVCDFCGRREYDIHALNRLTLILSPNAGNSPNKRRGVRTRVSQKTKKAWPSQPE